MEQYKALAEWGRGYVSPLLISDTCFDRLLLDLDLLHVECLKATVSKVAGYGILVFSSVLKLPLILNILASKSVSGLSASSIYLEATMYAASLVYHYYLGSPFSTYGEKYVLLLQNSAIATMIWYFTKKPLWYCFMCVGILVGSIYAMLILPAAFRHYLILYCTFGAFFSRVPQIAINFKNGHTGVLSPLTLFMGVFGALVRLLTVIQEVDDIYAIVGEALPLSLNVIILLQIIFYRNKTKQFFEDKRKKE
mmetsp:Transcript_4366/g.6489  ORF Transcript_4366/g.6489 Transcript_4366/m.6489 type:complete len:251 (+) Transcript_4366:91-843(+)